MRAATRIADGEAPRSRCVIQSGDVKHSAARKIQERRSLLIHADARLVKTICIAAIRDLPQRAYR